MPTYGTPETAKDFPPSDEMIKLRLKMAAIEATTEKALERLREKVWILSEGCDHHFIIAKDATWGWSMTLVPGVYKAVEKIPELDASRCGYSFLIECTRCGSSETMNISERCPKCASETKGDFAPATQKWLSDVDYWHKKYFGPGNYGCYDVWLIECTNPDCNFKAAGLRFNL